MSTSKPYGAFRDQKNGSRYIELPDACQGGGWIGDKLFIAHREFTKVHNDGLWREETPGGEYMVIRFNPSSGIRVVPCFYGDITDGRSLPNDYIEECLKDTV